MRAADPDHRLGRSPSPKLPRSTFLLALITALAALIVGSATAITLRGGDIIIHAEGGFAPKSLPRHADAPITIHGGGSLSTISGEPPPILETIQLEFDRHGSLETTGLEVCTVAKLRATTVAAARRACPNAIVGEGHGHAVVYFPEQRPIPADSPITLFNGPKVCPYASTSQRDPSRHRQPHARTRSGGHAAFARNPRSAEPRSQSDSFRGLTDRANVTARGELRATSSRCDASVIAHAFTTVPVATTFIVPITIERIHRGLYGYRTKARIPKIAGGAGIPISGHLKIGRKWTYKGVEHSYVNARCETGRLQARGQFTFKDGTYLSGTFVRPCKVRH